MPPNCFFTYVHAVTVPFQEQPLSATASMMVHPCSSVALLVKPASTALTPGFALAADSSLRMLAKQNDLEMDTTLHLQKARKT
jgi:hypothetical protein